MNTCKKCGEFFHTSKGCACKPFTVIDEDGDDHQVYAYDEYFAALKFAADSNEGNDYYLMNQSVEVTVGDKHYSISAWPDIHYSATEIKNELTSDSQLV